MKDASIIEVKLSVRSDPAGLADDRTAFSLALAKVHSFHQNP